MAKRSKRIVWDNCASEAWRGTRGGRPLCRIRRGPKSGRWMLLRIEDSIGQVAAWHGDYESLDEAKQAAEKLELRSLDGTA